MRTGRKKAEVVIADIAEATFPIWGGLYVIVRVLWELSGLPFEYWDSVKRRSQPLTPSPQKPASDSTATTLKEQARLISQGLLTILNSYSSKGYIDTGAHDVLISIARQAMNLSEALEKPDTALADLRVWLNDEEITAREKRILHSEDAPMWHTLNGHVNAYARVKAQIDKIESTPKKASGRGEG